MCNFTVEESEWLGQKNSKIRIFPLQSKTKAIAELKFPNTGKQLMSFLCAVNFLIKFVKVLAKNSVEFRNKMLTKYTWSENNEEQLRQIKLKIENITRKTHF